MAKLKILAIGNSFSVDAMEHLFKVALTYGYKQEDVILGDLYIGGCSLQRHYENISENLPAYEYFKNTNNQWIVTPETSVLTALKDEEWDYITMQQVSQNSGMTDTFEPYLSELIKYVNENKLNPTARLLWHSTWAYAANSDHSGFANYNNDQDTMYNAIIKAGKHVLENYAANIQTLIPSGTAIQNMRTAVGDYLNRDGFHLDLNYGRLTAALTWFKTIIGANLDGIKNDESLLAICESGAKDLSEKGVDVTAEELLRYCIASAEAAVENPFQATTIK